MRIDTSIDNMDTFAKVSILYRYLFSSILRTTNVELINIYLRCNHIFFYFLNYRKFDFRSVLLLFE